MESPAGKWLVLVAQLPTEDPASRMRVLRTLESLGAAVLREGVYVLPHTASGRQALEALADYISRASGLAHVLHASAATAAQQEGFARLFDRSARYDALIKTVESLRVSHGHSDPSAISRVLHKQRRELESIAALDFFPDGMQARARQALDEGEAAVRRLLASTQPKPAFDTTRAVQGRTWATRRPLWADRLACAWLIRRFVDPDASLLWLDKSEPPPADAIGYAFDGAHFGHGSRTVTFEDMLERFQLGANGALGRIGAIVHYLEMRDTPVAEAAGVHTLLQGAVRRSSSEAELLGEVEKTFDLLYEAYSEPARR